MYNTRSCPHLLSLIFQLRSLRLDLVRIGLRKDVLDGLVHCCKVLAYDPIDTLSGLVIVRVGAGGCFFPPPKIELTRVNGISILIRNLNAELLLNRHHYLHSVKAIQTKVVGKVSSGLDLFICSMLRQYLARLV